MKSFAIWLVIFLALVAGLFLVNHLALTAAPRKVLIAIDESFRMKSVERKVINFLKELKNKPYTQFSIITNRRPDPIHSWESSPKLTGFNAFGSWPLEKLLNENLYPLIGEARNIIILTNARDISALPEPGGKISIVQLTPLAD